MAVETSVAQMALTRDLAPGGFMDRVTAILAATATSVLQEDVNTPEHGGRASYAQQVVQGPGASGRVGGPQIVMAPAVVATTTYDETAFTSACTITDADLQTAILELWNGLAGIDTPSGTPTAGTRTGTEVPVPLRTRPPQGY